MSRKYIHYGSDYFEPSEFDQIENYNGIMGKPFGGLWASPVDSPNMSWKDFCKSNNFELSKLKHSFTFEIVDSANILLINSDKDVHFLLEDSELFSTRSLGHISWHNLDFEKLIEYEYDGIEVYMSSPDIYWTFYGWDVDSLLVFNPDILIL